MHFGHRAIRSLTILALAIVSTTLLEASTFQRASLDRLTAENETIVVADALGAHSYWNSDKSFILTDVNLQISQVIKGDPETRQVVVTLLGGTVGDITTLIPGGAALTPGRSYVVFLGTTDLPGTKGSTSVRDHSQGIFEIVRLGNELRATSQAAREPLMPDERGETLAAGGVEGFELGALIEQLSQLTSRSQETR